MTFADLLSGEAVFVDANTFLYHFGPDPVLGPPCSQLLRRIENQDVPGFTSLHLLPEVAHKMMTIEASALHGWPLAGMANRLRRNPAVVQGLTAFRRAIDQIARSRVQVLPVTIPLVETAALLSQQTGLLTNDALIVAIVQAHGLTRLASADRDFDRVPGITRYEPA